MRGGRLIKERTNERRWRRCIRLIKLRQSTGHEELIGQGQRDQERLRAVANTLGPALRLASNRHGAQPLHATYDNYSTVTIITIQDYTLAP